MSWQDEAGPLCSVSARHSHVDPELFISPPQQLLLDARDRLCPVSAPGRGHRLLRGPEQTEHPGGRPRHRLLPLAPLSPLPTLFACQAPALPVEEVLRE